MNHWDETLVIISTEKKPGCGGTSPGSHGELGEELSLENPGVGTEPRFRCWCKCEVSRIGERSHPVVRAGISLAATYILE